MARRRDAKDLLQLPRFTLAEIEEARTALADLAVEAAREDTAAVRAREQAATLSLQMEQLSSGAAISADEIASVRFERSACWLPLREHVLSHASLESPEEAVAAFEGKVTEADERSDLRFAAADESSRLTDMGQRRARLLLDADQAREREASAIARAEVTLAGWNTKLTTAGYPETEPSRIIGRLTERDAAEKAESDAVAAVAEAKKVLERRAVARAALVAGLPGSHLIEGVELAPVLATAELARAVVEAADQQRQLARAAAAKIELDADALARRRRRLDDAAAVRADAWQEAVSEAGITLPLSAAIATLDVLDELRAAGATQSDLKARIEGVTRDADEHDRSIAGIADRLGVAPAGNAEPALPSSAPVSRMRGRLRMSVARSRRRSTAGRPRWPPRRRRATRH